MVARIDTAQLPDEDEALESGANTNRVDFGFYYLECWDAVLQKRLAWSLFALLLSTLVC